LENYLWGEEGVQINALLAGTAWNLKGGKTQRKNALAHFQFLFATKMLSRLGEKMNC
jgi:IS5 family transposase